MLPVDRQPSPSSLTFGSNNPFRQRAAGANSPSPANEHAANRQFPFPTENRMSNNPFLDPEPNGASVVRGNKKPSDDLDIFVSLP